MGTKCQLFPNIHTVIFFCALRSIFCSKSHVGLKHEALLIAPNCDAACNFQAFSLDQKCFLSTEAGL